ncbi:MAG: hypothetical protein AUI85_11665 [Acidobacteriales bacterium 13_1_40CM_3_55_5]|nr:MAG: hypothetical protein AUI85_11665 [Acidobacteriales bacterium 13_1_40CM_3_55_5]
MLHMLRRNGKTPEPLFSVQIGKAKILIRGEKLWFVFFGAGARCICDSIAAIVNFIYLQMPGPAGAATIYGTVMWRKRFFSLILPGSVSTRNSK